MLKNFLKKRDEVVSFQLILYLINEGKMQQKQCNACWVLFLLLSLHSFQSFWASNVLHKTYESIYVINY